MSHVIVARKSDSREVLGIILAVLLLFLSITLDVIYVILLVFLILSWWLRMYKVPLAVRRAAVDVDNHYVCKECKTTIGEMKTIILNAISVPSTAYLLK